MGTRSEQILSAGGSLGSLDVDTTSIAGKRQKNGQIVAPERYLTHDWGKDGGGSYIKAVAVRDTAAVDSTEKPALGAWK